MKRGLLSIVFILSATGVGSAQQITYYFPQLAMGGGWMTTIFISNTMSKGTGTATIMLTKSDGTPMMSDWFDEMGNNVSKGGNAIAVQLGAGESRKFTSAADVPLTTGFATVFANSSAVLGNAMFTKFDADGNVLAEAGVPMAIPLVKQALFVDTTNGYKTGLAVANPNEISLQVRFDLINDTGQIISSIVRQIGASQQIALFLDELFPGVPAMVGRVQFSATNPVTSVALRFSAPGVPFTTLSPLAVAN
jgi:hypothetical protein